MFGRNAKRRRSYLYRKSVKSKDRFRLDRQFRVREALEKGYNMTEEELIRHLKDTQPFEEEDLDTNDPHYDQKNDPAYPSFVRQPVQGEFNPQQIHAMEKKKIEEALAEMDQENRVEQEKKILITSQRDCTVLVKQFIKELKTIFPNSQKMNRGKRGLPNVVEIARNEGFSDLILIKQNPKTGRPDGMVISHLPFGPTMYFTIYNLVTRHDIHMTNRTSPISMAYPHLIFHNFKTKLGNRVMNLMKYMFPVPKAESKRVITYANFNDFISFRQHVYEDKGGKVILKEVGPRMELQVYKITLGTLDERNADVEWVLGVYKNTYANTQQLGIRKTEDDRMIEDFN